MKATSSISLVKQKLESKDQLLARIWHSIELILFQLCMLGVVAQALLVYLICVQRCQSIVTIVAVGCGPMASPRFGRRHGSLPREQQPRTSQLRADAGPCIAEW
jgi:hypothetical protein